MVVLALVGPAGVAGVVVLALAGPAGVAGVVVLALAGVAGVVVPALAGVLVGPAGARRVHGALKDHGPGALQLGALVEALSPALLVSAWVDQVLRLPPLGAHPGCPAPL